MNADNSKTQFEIYAWEGLARLRQLNPDRRSVTVKGTDHSRITGLPAVLREMNSRCARPLEFSDASGTGSSRSHRLND